MIQARKLAIDVAARRVLSDASFTVNAGDKVGLVGRNGAGKTSLLKVLAGENDAAAGVVLRRGTLGYVPQNPRPRAEAAATALSHILSGKDLDRAATHLAELQRRLESDHSAAMIERYSEAEESYRHAGGYSRSRAACAQEGKRLTSLAWGQEAEIKPLSLLAEVMRRQTEKRAKQAKSIFTRVERMKATRVVAPRKERKVKISFPVPEHSGRVVLHGSGLAKGYGGPLVFREVSFEVERQDRLLVMGLNGAGKTSLLRILAGVSEPNAGSFRLGHGVSLGYYAQEHEGIRAGVSVLAHMREQAPDGEERVLRALLGMFGLTGDIARQDAGTLSGGEKTKLALAQLVAGRHNLLLLDEPTNNLDPPSRSGVARALAAWPGTMVIVSHDPEFVEALQPGRVMFMPEGRVDYWEEDLLDVVSMA